MSHRSGPGTLLDADLLTRLGRTLQELVTVGGDAERSRAYLGVEVLANAGSATPPPAGFVQARIDGVAILCRYYGNEPSVGQFVDALSIQNSNPIIFQNHTTGLVGAGWPFDTEILTVDSADLDADYSTIATAIAALAAGNVIVQSPEQFTCDDETLIANTDLLGWDKLRSILYTTQTTALTLAGTNYLRDVTVHADGDDAGNIAAIDINVSNSELEHVVALAEQAGEGDVAGITVDGAANNALLTDVRAQGVSSNGGSEYGLYIEAGGSVQRVQGGHYDGDTADVHVAAGAEVYLYGAVLEGGVVAGPGDAYGWYWDGAGNLYTYNANLILEDNVADALSVVDGGGLEYWRFDTRNAQPVTAVNLAGADIDFWVGISAGVPWFFVRGSDARVAVANSNPGYEFDVLGNIGMVGGAANTDRYIYFASDAYIFWNEAGDAISIPKKFGIGTPTVPHGGVGHAMFALDGADASAAGPHVQWTTAADDYPLLQILPWAHDNVSIVFDAYLEGGVWESADGSNFIINKFGDKLNMLYASGFAQGAAIAWSNGIILDLVTGYVGIGAATPAARTEVNTATADEPVLILQTTDDDATNPILDVQDSVGASLATIGATGIVSTPDGTLANPALAFLNEATMGWYRVGAENVALAVNGSVGTGVMSLKGYTRLGVETIVLGLGREVPTNDFMIDMYGPYPAMRMEVDRNEIGGFAFSAFEFYATNAADISAAITKIGVRGNFNDGVPPTEKYTWFGDAFNDALVKFNNTRMTIRNDVQDLNLTGALFNIIQADAIAAIPVLYLSQADLSEEMIEFAATIGVGNPIEAVGGKTLTVTHFIKITLPGGLTRYMPAGTIA